MPGYHLSTHSTVRSQQQQQSLQHPNGPLETFYFVLKPSQHTLLYPPLVYFLSLYLFNHSIHLYLLLLIHYFTLLFIPTLHLLSFLIYIINLFKLLYIHHRQLIQTFIDLISLKPFPIKLESRKNARKKFKKIYNLCNNYYKNIILYII